MDAYQRSAERKKPDSMFVTHFFFVPGRAAGSFQNQLVIQQEQLAFCVFQEFTIIDKTFFFMSRIAGLCGNKITNSLIYVKYENIS